MSTFTSAQKGVQDVETDSTTVFTPVSGMVLPFLHSPSLLFHSPHLLPTPKKYSYLVLEEEHWLAAHMVLTGSTGADQEKVLPHDLLLQAHFMAFLQESTVCVFCQHYGLQDWAQSYPLNHPPHWFRWTKKECAIFRWGDWKASERKGQWSQ